MLLALIASLVMLMGSAVPAAAQAGQDSADVNPPQPSPKLTAVQPSPDEDAAAEAELLALANQSRRAAGVPPLHADAGLIEAARAHAQRVVANGSLSHQFADEPVLLQRISQASSMHLDRAGENVADNASAENAHDALMHSPHHRQNLLDASFNAAGIAAIRSNGHLYVVEDFAHELPAYSTAQSEQLVIHGINEVRAHAGLRPLRQVTASGLDSAVCSLRQNRLSARPLNVSYPSREVVAYTQSQPEILPAGAIRMLRDPGIERFSVGVCYARDGEFPAGTYWVAILLY